MACREDKRVEWRGSIEFYTNIAMIKMFIVRAISTKKANMRLPGNRSKHFLQFRMINRTMTGYSIQRSPNRKIRRPRLGSPPPPAFIVNLGSFISHFALQSWSPVTRTLKCRNSGSCCHPFIPTRAPGPNISLLRHIPPKREQKFNEPKT